MKFLIRFLLLSVMAWISGHVSFAVSAQDWETRGFKLVETRELSEQAIYGSRPNAGYKLELDVVLLANGGWSKDQVIEKFKDAAKIYLQCSLKITRIRIHVVHAPENRADWKMFSNDGEDSIVWLRQNVPLRGGLTVFFVRQFPDKDYQSGLSSADWRDYNERAREELFDTIFLTNVMNSPEYAEKRAKIPSNTFAHEMLHVLTRVIAHYNTPDQDLLNQWRNRSNFISQKHCDYVRDSHLVRQAY